MPDAIELARQAEQLDEEQWFRFLDEIDEVARRRNRRELPDEPASVGRDDVAEWVARKYRIVDPSVRQIWYLPADAPPDEIRFLVINERIAGPQGRVDAFESWVEVPGGPTYTVLVGDVTTDQLDEIRHDPVAMLPGGWSLDDHRIWGRRD